MKKLIVLFLMVYPFTSKGQNIQVAFGTSLSSLDWQYKYSWGGQEEFYSAPIFGAAIDVGIEYFEKDWFSLTSTLGYFQSGGRIASDEVHDNWVIDEPKNSASNINIGTNFNFIPLNKRFQLMLSAGPRIDYLIPSKNSAMDHQVDIRKMHFGITGGLGLYYEFKKVKIGLRGNFLQRFTKLIDTEPSNNNNWWESPTLGVISKDKSIVNSQIVLGIKL